MTVFMLCERAIGLVRGNRLDLNSAERALLESLNYEALIAAHAQEEAVTCARHFEFVRDKLLQNHSWVFARKSAAPAQLSTALVGWEFNYALPTDYLKLLAVIRTDRPLAAVNYEVLGRSLGCRHSGVHIRYTAKVVDFSQWDAAFTDVFCSMLAGEAVSSIMGQINAVEMMEQRAQLGIQRAQMVGAIAGFGEVPLEGYPHEADPFDGYSGG